MHAWPASKGQQDPQVHALLPSNRAARTASAEPRRIVAWIRINRIGFKGQEDGKENIRRVREVVNLITNVDKLSST